MIGSITLDRDLASVKQARRFVADHLEGQDAQLVDDATLMVSELVTNAIRYGTGPCDLTIELTTQAVRIDVRDTATATRALRSPSPDDAFGRGLRIVSDLADDWGIDSTLGAGNTVWFSIQLRTTHVADQLSSTAGNDISNPPPTRSINQESISALCNERGAAPTSRSSRNIGWSEGVDHVVVDAVLARARCRVRQHSSLDGRPWPTKRSVALAADAIVVVVESVTVGSEHSESTLVDVAAVDIRSTDRQAQVGVRRITVGDWRGSSCGCCVDR